MSEPAAWPRLVTADDHVTDMATLMQALPVAMPRAGVVHVGAHRGEEVDIYRRAGFSHVVLIEANPEHASALRERFAADPEVRILSTAVGERTGSATLLVHASRSGSTEPASLLPLQELQRIVPTVSTRQRVTVPITTLDALTVSGDIDPQRYNLLVVDVQGAESLVFRGARQMLRGLDAIVTEVNVIPLYEGALLEGELLAELRGAGFVPRLGVYHELYEGEQRFVAWGECLLVNEATAGR